METKGIAAYTGPLSWELCNGVLTISGHGDMQNYSSCDEYIGESWENIPPWFGYKETITSIIIKPEVRSIGDYAFKGCINLISISISDSIMDIGEKPFYCCPKLTSFNVDSMNFVYSSQDGVLFNKDKTVLVEYPYGKKEPEYIVPDGVISIEDMDCVGLSSITLPNSIVKLPEGFFYSSGSLRHIYLKNEIPPKVRGGEDGIRFPGNEYDPFIGNPPDVDIRNVCKVHVPIGSKKQYQEAYFWKDYEYIQDDIEIPKQEFDIDRAEQRATLLLF